MVGNNKKQQSNANRLIIGFLSFGGLVIIPPFFQRRYLCDFFPKHSSLPWKCLCEGLPLVIRVLDDTGCSSFFEGSGSTGLGLITLAAGHTGRVPPPGAGAATTGRTARA